MPRPWAIPRVRAVFPAPRSPEKAMTSLGDRVAAIAFPRDSVASGDVVW